MSGLVLFIALMVVWLLDGVHLQGLFSGSWSVWVVTLSLSFVANMVWATLAHRRAVRCGQDVVADWVARGPWVVLGSISGAVLWMSLAAHVVGHPR